MIGGEGSPPLHLPAGYRLDEAGVITSTSDACAVLARTGGADGHAIVAEGQTAARGSRGRGWAGSAGNLYLSVLIRPQSALEASAQSVGAWALLAGVACIDALSAAEAEPAALSLKWPNDVLRAGLKLGGILVEAEAAGDTLGWLVIGFGANLAEAPAVPGRQTAVLRSRTSRLPPPPREVAAAVLRRIAYWRGRWAEDGFASISVAWLAAAHPIGTPITIRDVRGERVGVFAGLSAEGALLLQEPSGDTVSVSTGEIFLSQGG